MTRIQFTRLIAGLLLVSGGCRTHPAQNDRTAPETTPEILNTNEPKDVVQAPMPRSIVLSEGIVVQTGSPEGNSVEIDAVTPLDEGWLEQVACSPNTREHESLLVIEAKPSQVHAALLMAGFEPGSPGRWTYENKTFGAIDPTGEQLDLIVRYRDEQQNEVTHSIRTWMRHPTDPEKLPDQPWVFGGSSIQPNPPSMGPGEHYVADFSGSIIGVVTFGDEVIGYGRVLADQDAVQDPVWEANPDTMPPPGTKVTLIVRKFSGEQR